MEIENVERIILENDKRPAAAEILRLFEFELATRGLAKDGFHEVQFQCGHPVACIKSTDEGTHHCGWCEELAEARAENERLREEITSARIALSGLDASLDVLEELMHGGEDETP